VAEAEMWRGMAYRRQGQFELAIADLTSSIETSKGLVDHFNLSIEYINRGRTYEVQGFHQDALSDFKRAVALDPRSYAGYEGLGVVHQDMGFHDLAIADYTRAIALQPTYGALYVYRANSYQAEGLQDQAIVDYARAITIITPDVARSSPVLHADLATAYNGRAWSYHLKMEDALALPDAEEAVTLAPQSAEAIETRAEVYERLGRRDDAIAEYRAALKLRPAMVPAKNGLVRLGAGP
jgi:tetratricopeptide (TPR) repeat protein